MYLMNCSGVVVFQITLLSRACPDMWHFERHYPGCVYIYHQLYRYINGLPSYTRTSYHQTLCLL